MTQIRKLKNRLKMFLLGIALIAIVAIAVFNMAVSSEKDFFGDMKLANIEVLAGSESDPETLCYLIGKSACEVSSKPAISYSEYCWDEDYYRSEGYEYTYNYCGLCYSYMIVYSTWGCC